MRDVIIEHVEAENAIDVGRVLDTYSRVSPSFEDVAAFTRCSGGEEIIAEYSNVWGGFPNLKRDITRWTFGDNSVVIEVTVSGAHEGVFRGVSASGREISLRGIAHFQFDPEGRIEKETVYYD